MKMLRVGFLVVCMLIVTVAGFCSPKENADEIKNGKSYLAEVYESSSDVKSMHVELSMNIKNNLGGISASSKIDLLNDPTILGKINSEIVMAGSEKKLTISQYISQEGDKLITYSKFADKWEKQTIPYKDAQALPETKEVMSYIKSVKIKEQTAQKIILDISIDMAKVRRSFQLEMKDSIVSTTGLSAADSQEMIKTIDEVLAAMGNITYTVKIDKQSKQVVSAYSDLSNAAQKTANFLIKKLPMADKEKAVYQAFTNNISFTIKEDISQYNNVPKFTIPEDIVKNAKEMKSNKKIKDVQVDKKDEPAVLIPEEIESKL